MAKIQMARMSITGAHLTNHARELMSEGEWKLALNFLTQTLGGNAGEKGMSIEQAISVLAGDMRLTGSDNDIGMEAEAPEVKAALMAEYQDLYELSGYLKVDGHMYQAYGFVDNLGPEDGWKHKELHSGRPKTALCPQWYDRVNTVEQSCCYPAVFSHEDVAFRARKYAASPVFDRVYVVTRAWGERVVALFKAVDSGTTPFWLAPECTSPQDAFANVELVLTTTGYCQYNGYDLEEVLTEQNEASKDSRAPTESEVAEKTEQLRQRDTDARNAEEAFRRRCEEIRCAVVAFADSDEEYGWMTHHWANPGEGADVTLRVPKRAMYCYALSVTAFRNLMPSYEPVSESGLKMVRDNPFHSDVWLGAGYSIDDAYDRNNPVCKALEWLQYKIQKELLKFSAHVLSRGMSLTGKVVFSDCPNITSEDVLVLPHGGEEFHVQAMKAGAIICEVGGKVSHLAIVCREQGKSVVRIDDAMTRFYRGQLVTVDSTAGKVVGSNSYSSPAGAF